MNREQLIEKALRALTRSSWPDGGRDGFPGMVVAGMLAPRVVDAILPQVTTVEELEALNPRALVLKDFDGRAQTEEAGSLARAVRLLGSDFLPTSPMTVVWQP